MSVNKVILVGNVGKDPEVRYLEGGTAVCRFSLATSETYKNREGEKVTTTEWHNIVLWKGLAEIAEKFVKKGMQLYIEGRIKTRSYNNQDGNTKYITEIVGDTMQMLGRKSDDSQYTTGSSGSESSDNSPRNQTESLPEDARSEVKPEKDFISEPTDPDDLPF